MANKKAEILTMDGQVVSPITLATNVLLDDGRTAQDLLDSRDESMFSPTIITSSSISKVGQGDNVDFSENIIDGAYKSCVLKGKTLVNHNAEGNNRNDYACMPSLEGSNLTVNGTVEGKVKSAILKGQTLVNCIIDASRKGYGNFSNNISIGNDGWITATASASNNHFELKMDNLNIKPSTKYLFVFECESNSYQGNGTNNLMMGNTYPSVVDSPWSGQLAISYLPIGVSKFTLTTKSDFSSLNNPIGCRSYISVGTGVTKFRYMIIEYQEGMENWDIPYFTGMQSVKMPVLTTAGKNLFELPQSDKMLKGSIGKYIKLNLKPNTNYTYNSILDKKGNTSEFDFYGWISNDINSNFTGYEVFHWKLNKTFSKTFNTGNDEWYFHVYGEQKGDDYRNYLINFQLEEGSTATSYEPYKTNILTVNEPVELRGIGEVRDTLDCLTGKATERIGEIMLDGSEGVWSKHSGLSTDEYDVYWTSNGFIPSVGKKMLSDKLGYSNPTTPNTFRINDSGGLFIGVSKGVNIRDYLSQNTPKIQYDLTEPTIKTVDLSDNVVHSYKDTTHYTCSSEDGSLIPTLTIEEGVRYKVIIKPSTKYSIVFNRTEVASGLTVDLGGATANITSTTLGKNIVQITTPSTLSHNYVIFKGLGNVIKDVQVIEGEVVGDEPYFEGMVDVKNPVVTNVGKNLINIKKAERRGASKCSLVNNGDGSITLVGDGDGTSEGIVVTTCYVYLKQGKAYTFSFESDGQYSNINGTDTVEAFLLKNGSASTRIVRMSGFITTFVCEEDGDYYVRFDVNKNNTTHKFWNVQLTEGSNVCPYKPYKSNTVTFDQKDGKTIVLRSLPNGVSDTLDLETGEYVQRIGEIVLEGSEEWSKYSNNTNEYNTTDKTSVFYVTIAGKKAGYGTSICDTFVNTNDNSAFNMNYVKQFTYSDHLNLDRCYFDYGDNNEYMVNDFKTYLQQNPITVQYELATPIITTIDLKQHPFAYKDGYIVLTSSSEEVSLTPTIEYSLIANRLGQIQTNQKLVEKQQAQIDELESMVITNLVNTQYQQALNEIKLGVK